MRRPFTTAEAAKNELSKDALKWAVKIGTMQRPLRGVYLMGAEPPSPIEAALAHVIGTDGVASHTLAGKLHGLDGVSLSMPYVSTSTRKRPNHAIRHRSLPSDRVTSIRGYHCTNGPQTLEDLADELTDIRWEQAMESALFKKLVTVEQLEASGNRRIQRVMAMRPAGAPPTESKLETMAVQLIRTEPLLPTPLRQVVVLNKSNQFVARVDLAWPEYGIFLELDGCGHKNQPVYDAYRQTAVIAAKGWLVGRFTWFEIDELPKRTVERMMELFEQASLLRRSN